MSADVWHPDMPDEYKNQIVTGDARELAKRIPDESIDLIFTDPVYDQIEDYEWLAEEADRILKNTGALLVWQKSSLLPETFRSMNGHLRYRWILIWQKISRQVFTRCPIGINVGVPCLYFSKELHKSKAIVADIQQSKEKAISEHYWSKPQDVTRKWMIATTKKNDIVLDTFSGSATVPTVCKILGRNYIAFEIDPDTAEIARERVRNTQPPLFVLEPEQLEFFDEP